MGPGSANADQSVLELAGNTDTGCATLHVLHGGAHGGPDFYDRRRMTWVRQFLKTHLP